MEQSSVSGFSNFRYFANTVFNLGSTLGLSATGLNHFITNMIRKSAIDGPFIRTGKTFMFPFIRNKLFAT